MARLLELDADSRAQNGDSDGALEDVRAIINVARSMELVPGLWFDTSLMEFRWLHVALTTLERVLAQGEPSDAALAKLDPMLAEVPGVPFREIAYRGERATEFELVAQCKSDNPIWLEKVQISAPAGLPGGPPLPWGPFDFARRDSLAIILRHWYLIQAMEKAPKAEAEELLKTWRAECDLTHARSRLEIYLGRKPITRSRWATPSTVGLTT